MMSPIAILSAKEARNRPVIKGTGRRRTVYRRPPIVELIGMCRSIQALGRLRGALALGSLKGTIDPSEKTERAWEQAFWKRVVVIMLTTKKPSFVYNEVLRWGKPAWAAEAIEVAFKAQCQSLP